MWTGDFDVIKQALERLAQAVMQVERGLDVCIRATNGDVFKDDSIGPVPIRFAVHYTYVGPQPAGAYEVGTMLKRTIGADLKFSLERGKGSYLDFIVTLQPSDKQIWRPLFVDKLSNIPMFVLSNEPPPNRAIHGNLRYWGLRCDGAPTFQEGILEITRQATLDEPYRLIIVSQPIEDGTAEDVAREIKQSGLRGTKLIHIDRFFDEQRKEASLQAGFDAYMAKPFTTIELLSAVSAQLGISLEP
jgi:CheY-like chemotaxis protein